MPPDAIHMNGYLKPCSKQLKYSVTLYPTLPYCFYGHVHRDIILIVYEREREREKERERERER